MIVREVELAEAGIAGEAVALLGLETVDLGIAVSLGPDLGLVDLGIAGLEIEGLGTVGSEIAVQRNPALAHGAGQLRGAVLAFGSIESVAVAPDECA